MEVIWFPSEIRQLRQTVGYYSVQKLEFYYMIRDAILTCTRKLTWVSLICRTDTTTVKEAVSSYCHLHWHTAHTFSVLSYIDLSPCSACIQPPSQQSVYFWLSYSKNRVAFFESGVVVILTVLLVVYVTNVFYS